MAKYEVATVEEIPVGERKLINVAGRSIGVFNVAGEYYALRNTCPHQGGPLCEGHLTGFLTAPAPGEYQYARRGEILRCPWHGWEFDVKTGQSWVDPVKTRVRTYPVSVEVVDPVEAQVLEGTTLEDAKMDTTPVDAETGQVQGPYIAESYHVSVEQRFIFVEIS